MFYQSVPQECLTRVSHKSVPQECPTRVGHSVSQKSVPHDCPRRVSSKSVLQEWLLISFNAIQHLLFAFHCSVGTLLLRELLKNAFGFVASIRFLGFLLGHCPSEMRAFSRGRLTRNVMG